MRFPYSWLRDVVRAGAPGWDASPDELEQTFLENRIAHLLRPGAVPPFSQRGALTSSLIEDLRRLAQHLTQIRDGGHHHRTGRNTIQQR